MDVGVNVGKTKSAGYQIGVRRTFSVNVEEAWNMLLSPQGIGIWLGELPSFHLAVGVHYTTKWGITGEIRVVNELENIRLTWKKQEWDKASTLQIRTIRQKNDKCTISFHQENLQNSGDREEMKTRWEEVLDRLKSVL